MTLEEASLAIQTALDAKTSVLVNEIRRMLVERPFVLTPGISRSAINGVHFEYDWSSYQTVACPLNTSTGYCGSGERLQLVSGESDSLIPEGIESEVLQTTSTEEHDAILDSLDELTTEIFCSWFSAGWKIAREAEPSVRGFLSVHDTIWRTDLDTGKEFREDAGAVRFF